MTSLLRRCEETFAEPVAFSSCAEQAARLVEGMPQLPRAEEPAPVECADWPAPWVGLCQRATDLAARPIEGVEACEDRDLARYATELPGRGRLFDAECLAYAHDRDPWCAIGVARERDGVDCVWTGAFGAEDSF